MRWIALALVLASTPVEAHCFARWYYPWPQRCGVHSRFSAPPSRAQKSTFVSPGRGPSGPDIPLPFLAQADLDGGAADEPTRARLELLGYAYAH